MPTLFSMSDNQHTNVARAPIVMREGKQIQKRKIEHDF
jgi:hypothetical protein